MYYNFTSNESINRQSPTKTVVLIADTNHGTGTWGSGTLTLRKYSAELDDYLVVDSWTADTAQEVVLGVGAGYQLEVSGASSPDIRVSVDGAYGD